VGTNSSAACCDFIKRGAYYTAQDEDGSRKLASQGFGMLVLFASVLFTLDAQGKQG
jgi:hypothetical protein